MIPSAFALLSAGLLATTVAAPAANASDVPDIGSAARADRVTLPQSFVEQQGGFVMLGDGLSATFETGRMRWILTGESGSGLHRRSVTVEPVGARAGVAPAGEDLLPGVVSHFRGPPSEWRTGRTFRALRYAELWSGIDLLLEAEGQMLKGTYVVAPGADPGAVRLRHRGADAVTIDETGRLVVHTDVGDLVDAAPVAWQEIDGARRDVPVAFALEPRDDGSVDVLFDLDAHDPSVPLLLDPAVIVQAGFLGGAVDDRPGDIEVDDDGCVYIAGGTTSSDFPVLGGPDLTFAGPVLSTGGDAYVATLDPTGTTLLYAGFLGGTQREAVWDTALDSLGRLYICGLTESSPAQGFPTLIGPSVNQPGNCDGIVARVSADGTALEYCGYIGGNGEDFAAGIDVDDSFRAWVVGRFDSLAATLPIHGGPVTSQPGGAYDSFVARIRADGFWHDFCGYLGGDDIEDIQEVVADDAGGAWFAGYTWSQDFPTVGALGPTGNGSIDIIVGRVAPDGLSLTSCGYVGGDGTDVTSNIAIDDDGAVYVAGLTFDAFSFPAVVGPSLTPTSSTDGVVMKVAPDGQSLEWAGFTNTGNNAEIEIDDADRAWYLSRMSEAGSTFGHPKIARVALSGTEVEAQGVIDLPNDSFVRYFTPIPSALTPGASEFWVTGWTSATEATFPVVSGPDVTHNGGQDTVVMRVRITGETWSDLGNALAGTHGDPLLVGTGPLAPLTPLSLSLSNALGSAPAWLVYSFTPLFAAFKGGVMVPDPSPPLGDAIQLTTSAAGGFDLAGTWPGAVAPGLTLYLQTWIADPAGPLGFAASNAVQETTD